MTISISNVVFATHIFTTIFVFVFLLSLRLRSDKGFSLEVTTQLKGFSILAIVFSHIGYFLVDDQRFLFPLSIAAGVGVNIFLILSGYGLATSSIAKQLPILKFYKRRLPKLYVPFWISIAFFFLLDFFVLGKDYSAQYVVKSFAGLFEQAHLFSDLNSPLWYFTAIIFYYLLFPMVFSRRMPVVSALLLYLAGYFVIVMSPAFLNQVLGLYELHIVAFPLGVLFAAVAHRYNIGVFQSRIKCWLQEKRVHKNILHALHAIFMIVLVFIIGYTAYRSHVGDVPAVEQRISLITSSALLVFFTFSKMQSKVLNWFGMYSFEIYLLHWPILSRFDMFFRFFPPWLATICYLIFFIGTGWILRTLTNRCLISAQ